MALLCWCKCVQHKCNVFKDTVDLGILVNISRHKLWFVFLPTFTCLMLHKRHLNIFLTRLWWPDFQQLRDKNQWTLPETNEVDSTRSITSHKALVLPAWWHLRCEWDGTPGFHPHSNLHTSPGAHRRGCRCAPPLTGTPAPPPPASQWSGRSCGPKLLGTSTLGWEEVRKKSACFLWEYLHAGQLYFGLRDASFSVSLAYVQRPTYLSLCVWFSTARKKLLNCTVNDHTQSQELPQ